MFGDKRNTNILKNLLKSILNFSDEKLSKIEIIESSIKIEAGKIPNLEKKVHIFQNIARS
ncbi:MAG: hypothetical protein LBJ93_02765 [Clostridiales bacterium]|nr:hypothetical protein [Clostridiales bacterium]